MPCFDRWPMVGWNFSPWLSSSYIIFKKKVAKKFGAYCNSFAHLHQQITTTSAHWGSHVVRFFDISEYDSARITHPFRGWDRCSPCVGRVRGSNRKYADKSATLCRAVRDHRRSQRSGAWYRDECHTWFERSCETVRSGGCGIEPD